MIGWNCPLNFEYSRVGDRGEEKRSLRIVNTNSQNGTHSPPSPLELRVFGLDLGDYPYVKTESPRELEGGLGC
jgi:hypothetical protein